MMDREQFAVWAKAVRAAVNRHIQRGICVTGDVPKAIIVGGEYQYVFLCDREDLRHTADGGCLWRGVPVIRSGRHNKVSVVWTMEDIIVPPPMEEEQASSSPVGSANKT